MSFPPDRKLHPLRGIDASNHQGAIDWGRVAADDVSFAILKATEGGDFLDRSFARNVVGARAAGLAVGAYHFFTFCRPGAEQAANFLAAVTGTGVNLLAAVDIEFEGNCDRRPEQAELAAELKAFLDPVEAAFGAVTIYITGAAAEAYGAVMPGRPRWLRSLGRHPDHEDWICWQYDDHGSVDGIQGPVDLNVMRRFPEALAAL